MLVVIVINRLLRDDVSKGKTSTKEKTSLRDIWNTLKDPALIGKVIMVIFLHHQLTNERNRILVLGSDNLYGKEPSFTVPCSQSTTAWFHEIRKYRLDHTL